MKGKILIVEDEYILANGLRLMLEKAGFEVCELAESVPRAREVIRKESPSLVILDIQLDGELSGIDLAKELNLSNIGFIYVSANSNQAILEAAKRTEPYGFLIKPYREKDLLIAIDIANYRQRQKDDARLRRQNLLESNLAQIVSIKLNDEQKLLQIALALQPDIPFDFISISIKQYQNEPNEILSLLRISFNEYQFIPDVELMQMTGIGAEQLNKMNTAEELLDGPIFCNEEVFKKAGLKNPAMKMIAATFGMGSSMHATLPICKRKITLSFFSRITTTYEQAHVQFLKDSADLWGITMEKLLTKGNLNISSQPVSMPQKEKAVFKAPVFQTIIGNSPALLKVFDHISRVAPMDTSVLIFGESGTGKEKIAKSIHELSLRRNHPFIVVNCAALPANLIESELFGHEKGAFTGAVVKRVGKFEQATNGSIFLDEIGELPLDLQAKLLRTLQEKEVERLGGNKSFKLNVRVIAATNRNLEKEVAEGRFRLDLYYRLNAFPVTIPPLRERKNDIPLLVDYFMKEFAEKAERELSVASKAMQHLMSYNWPGNIRELEHVVERSAVLTTGETIEEFLLPQNFPGAITASTETVVSMEDAERNHIINTLKKTNNRIYGEGGAAELLQLPPTTLTSKMKKLGIDKNII